MLCCSICIFSHHMQPHVISDCFLMLIFNRLMCITIDVFEINFFERGRALTMVKYYYSRDLLKQVSEIVLGTRAFCPFWYQT